MLCSALAGSLLAGNHAEFLHQAGLEDEGHPEETAESLNRYMEKIVSNNSGSNGVFGMKIHFNQFDNVFSESKIGLRNGLEFLGRFQKYILVYRSDKVLQAISELLAEESGLWNSEETKTKFSLGRPFEETDILNITQIMNRQIHEDYAWRAILRNIGADFHSVRYEDLANETDRELQAVRDYLGIGELENVKLVEKTVKVSDPAIASKMKQDYLTAIGCFST